MTCGQEMDVRGGRASRHWMSRHGDRPAATAHDPGSGFVAGSREWSVVQITEIARSLSSTPEQKLKALDLLKEYENYGSKRLDDEKEAAESAAQWDRILAQAADLREQERILLRDPAVIERLREALPKR